MGVEPFLIASSVIGVLAQRLVRKICPHCKTEFKESRSALEELTAEEKIKNQKTFIGSGCTECKNTGYKGRIGIFELMEVNEQIKELILAKASSSTIAKAAQEKGMVTLHEDGIKKVLGGQTSIAEVVRVTKTE
jgi:type II secretory ATPase GspE/PulE/Tfp pilus assembly ATPase PilB-like protein